MLSFVSFDANWENEEKIYHARRERRRGSRSGSGRGFGLRICCGVEVTEFHTYASSYWCVLAVPLKSSFSLRIVHWLSGQDGFRWSCPLTSARKPVSGTETVLSTDSFSPNCGSGQDGFRWNEVWKSVNQLKHLMSKTMPCEEFSLLMSIELS